MLFSAEAWPGIADGSITLTFRAWKRPQAKVGGRYRIAGMTVEVTDVRQIAATDITPAEARRAGAAGPAEVRNRLGDAQRVWRVEFVLVGADDRIARRLDTAPAEVERVVARLARFDRRAPWTRATLDVIARHPGVVSTTLAAELGQDRAPFKLNVRKLKELGLTESLEVGYRLSPRGEAVLRALNDYRPAQ